jgi:DNA repair exonuclease
MIKVLHCADIHLDCPFASENPANSELRRNELRNTFVSTISYAKRNNADIVLIAGDLFDTNFITKETVNIILDEFASMPDCRFIISPGNHDPYTDNSVYNRVLFPDNVYIFNQETLSYFDFEEINTNVYGYAFTKSELLHNPFAGHKPHDSNMINLLCAHGDLTFGTKYCPITKDEIRSSGFDYIALGHIHNTDGVEREGNVRYAFSGCLEGRDFGETGYKGALWLETDKNYFKCDKIRFSKRRYESDRVNVTGCSAIPEVTAIINKHITDHGYGNDTILRLYLEGDIDPEFTIPKSILKDYFRDLCEFIIIDNTSPLYDYNYLKDDPTIRGAFFNKLLPLIQTGTQEERDIAVKALRYGLSAISGSNIIDFEL